MSRIFFNADICRSIKNTPINKPERLGKLLNLQGILTLLQNTDFCQLKNSDRLR